ncbi:MAG: pantoate--beta-alanine ligase [Firmicutes bacterium]|jgi:pantoate--beta-alanine ligase|nr:pantoate--beta-alanine ligase [Bacillota bacterium]
MQVIRDFKTLKSEIAGARRDGKSVGFVPTMGFLHEGHLSLLREAVRQTEYVVLSIFVNPLQFGVGEDYEEYPRDLEQDRKKAEEAGCDLIFYPEVKSMYPRGYLTYVNTEGISEPLCGGSRPGHFRGVTTVVTKLFNLVTPDKAFFGQKDAQQALIIRKMVADLNMNLEIVVCPTIREDDGLAMSSRNAYLEPGERKAAAILYRTLKKARDMVLSGEKDARVVRDFMVDSIGKEPRANIQYIEVVDSETLQPLEEIETSALLALAVKFGETRLIDNILVEV